MRKSAITLAVLALGSGNSLSAQIEYEVSFPNVVHHEAEIAVTFTALPAVPLELRMSRSSPGRYALHEFAKNVYSVRATDGEGHALVVERPNPYQWDVPVHDATVRVTYTLFADRADGTYSQVDPTHAHLNIPATFMWARGLGDREIRITFTPPEGSEWKVATQLFPTDDPMTFTAPNLYYFMDSPTELSDFALREWTVASNGEDQTIRVAVHHDGSDAEVDVYAQMVREVVEEEIAVFGEAPEFDGGTYTFIADYLPYVSGDGMEHRNSTILASTRALRDGPLRLLGTVSHEFFHSWNVERIRPRTLEPFDFERANMSRELWFAEGFTSYYTPLFIRRAGLTTVEQYATAISGGLSFVINAPGREYFTPIEMSMQAPFVDAATAVDPTNRANTFISYYTWGSVIALNLDLTLRSRFDSSLDGYMRAVWQRFGKPEVAYTVDDLEQTLGAFTVDDDFATDFFAQFVRGREVPDYVALLANAGFLLRPAQPNDPWLGMSLNSDERGVRVATTPSVGGPAYLAGISRGDRVVSIADRPVMELSDVSAVLAQHEVGDSIAVALETRGGMKTVIVELAAIRRLEVVPYEQAGMDITEAMMSFRRSWLESKAKSSR
ncbi:MAG: M61 family metallopeptidase [Acidobacteria bacterium]|nr:M61 family metallopeptidase [Acidobacteriota bacterium]